MAERGDRGNLHGDDGQGDRGPVPGSGDRGNDQGPGPQERGDRGPVPGSRSSQPPLATGTSYDMFGNPILPAKADSGSAFTSDSAAPKQETPHVKIPKGATVGKSSGGPSPVTLILGGAALIIGAYFGYTGYQNSHSSGSSSASKTVATASSETKGLDGLLPGGVSGGGGQEMSAKEVFKTCSPSVVTLLLVIKAYGVKCPGGELTTSDDSPIVAAKVDDTLTLFEKNKPVKTAHGFLTIKGKKLPVTVTLSGGHLSLTVTDENGHPVVDKNGRSLTIAHGLGLEPFSVTAQGSGFYVQPDVVVTNCHVVSAGGAGTAGFAGGMAQITDSPAKFVVEQRPIVIDDDHDLAVLYVPGTGAKPLPMLTDYSLLKVGQPVFAIGTPKGMAGSMVEGLVSSDKLRSGEEIETGDHKLYLQHSAKIDHGNSGGPLLDSHGRVIGVNTAGMGNGAINFAVVSKFIKELLDKPQVQAKIESFRKKEGTDLKG